MEGWELCVNGSLGTRTSVYLPRDFTPVVCYFSLVYFTQHISHSS